MMHQFSASLDHLHEMLSFICQNGLKAGFQESHMYQIELAVEEALVNIIMYAFIDKRGMIQIECKTDDLKRFAIMISDPGVPYNPLNSGRMYDISAAIENMSVGGWGIFFILKIMDEVKYKHENGKNVLTLVKYKSE